MSHQPLFCCTAAQLVDVSNSGKVYNDDYRSKHAAIFESFLNFADRRQRSWELLNLILGNSPNPLSFVIPSSAPTSTPSALTLSTNPLDPNTTKSVIYVTSRQDFGPVLSHRYFVQPDNLEDDWIELSQLQWWATGAGFAYTADKRDLKCLEHERFFRLQLRPNLQLRNDVVGLRL